MSSYQFVSSLASCYAGQQPQQQPRPTPNSPGEPMQAASPAGGDYYNPNAASTSYPAPCYSPQQHYPQHPYATPASGMQHTAPTGMIDYTQLQPQPRLNATATSQQQHGMHAQQTQHHPQQPHHPQQQLHPDPTTPLLQGASAPSAPSTSSCKYADSTSSTSVASPQDLTTSTSRNSPTPLQVAPGTSKAASGLTSPPGSSSRSSVAASAASPPSGSSRGVGEGNSTLTTASSASSPASSTSSTSSTGNNSSNKGNPSGSNPPQIYPWMKRVHIGQKRQRERENISTYKQMIWLLYVFACIKFMLLKRRLSLLRKKRS
ncbi:hypothetical protein ACFW04_003163 [Cataglyphis niger]